MNVGDTSLASCEAIKCSHEFHKRAIFVIYHPNQNQR